MKSVGGLVAFRYTLCELHHFGVLEPLRSLVLQPGLNLIVGDRRKGKTTVVEALLAAWRGLTDLPASSENPGLRLQFVAGDEEFELVCNFAIPRVEMISSDSGRLLFAGPSWTGLLPALEEHTGFRGLGPTLRLPVDLREFMVPPDLCALFGVPSRTPGKRVADRVRIERLVAELTTWRDRVAKSEFQLAGLQRPLADPQYAALVRPNGELLRDLGRLAAARQQLDGLTADEATRATMLADLEAQLHDLRRSLNPVFQVVGADFPRDLRRYHELEPVCVRRRAEVAGLQQTIAQLEDTLLRPGDALAPELEPILDRGPGSGDDVAAALQAVEDALLPYQRWIDAAEDFPDQVAELVRARKALATGVAKLDALHREEVVVEAACPQMTPRLSPPENHVDLLAERLRGFEGLQNMADVPQRVDRLVRTRSLLAQEALALQQVQQRLGDIAAILQQTSVSLMDDLQGPSETEGLCRRLLAHLEAEQAERPRLEAQLQSIDDELEALSPWAGLPDGYPILRTVLHDVDAELAEQERALAELDQQMAEVSAEDKEVAGAVLLSLPEGLCYQVARWEEHFRGERQAEILAGHVAKARKKLNELEKQMAADGLPLEAGHIADYEAHQLEIEATLRALDDLHTESAKAGRKKGSRAHGALPANEQDALRHRLVQAEAALAILLETWQVPTTRAADALLAKHRVARERMISARAQLSAYEILLTHARDPVDSAAVDRRGPDWCHSLLVLEARRSELLRGIQRLRQRAGPIRPAEGQESDVQAFQRQRDLQAQRQDVVSRLAVLRPLGELSADRHELLELLVRAGQDPARPAALPADVTAYNSYRALVAEQQELESQLSARWHAGLRGDGALETDVDRLHRTVADLEASLAPWGASVRTEADGDSLLARWKEAREVQEALTVADTGVPETHDTSLMERLEAADAWRTRLQSIVQERLRAEQALSSLQARVSDMEESLGIGPTEEPERVLHAFQEVGSLKAHRESLRARLQLRSHHQPELEALHWSLRDAVEGANGQGPLSRLEEELALLRDRLGGRHGVADVEAELEAWAAHRKVVEECEVLQHRMQELHDDTALHTLVQRTRDVIAETESHLQARFPDSPGVDILATYQDVQACRAEAESLEEALHSTPSRAELSLRLEVAQHRLRVLTSEDGAASDAAESIALNAADAQCLVRASDLLAHITGGRHPGLCVRRGTVMIDSDGDWCPLPENGGVRQAAELSWLLAVCLELGDHYRWPILLDEPFVHLDDDECTRVLDLLRKIATERQVIVLTARRTLGLRPRADLGAAAPAEVKVAPL